MVKYKKKMGMNRNKSKEFFWGIELDLGSFSNPDCAPESADSEF